MALNHGPNAGVSGLIALPGTSGVKIQCECYGLSVALDMALKPRLGRGSGRWPGWRQLTRGGTFAVTGTVKAAGQPLPAAWNGQEGTVYAAFDVGKFATYPVKIIAAQFGYTDKTKPVGSGQEGEWGFAATCQIIGEPTYTGWGNIPTATDATPANQEQWGELTAKILDPNGIQSGATVAIDIWGTLTDSNSAEEGLLAAVVAAAVAPMTGLKLRTARYNRDSLDGGQVLLTFGLTSTDEDILNQTASTTTDPNGLQSRAVVAKFGSAPTSPGGTFKKRAGTTREINDGKVLYADEYGLTDAQEDIENGGSYTADDASDLADSATIVLVQGSSTPSAPATPAGLKLIRTITRELNDAKWRHEWQYGKQTAEDEIEQGGSQTADCASDLADRQTIVEVQASATPSAPATPSGLKLVETITQPLNDAKWRHEFRFARQNREDEIEQGGTQTVADPVNLSDEATITAVTTSGTPATAPAAPTANTKHVGTVTRQLHDGKWSHTYRYSTRDSEDAIEFEGTADETDAAGLADEARITQVTTSGTAPAAPSAPVTGTKLVRTVTQQLTGNRWRHSFLYGRQDSEDRIEHGGWRAIDDEGGLEDEGTVTVVHTSSTPSAAPAAPVSGTKHVGTDSRQLHSGKWAHTYRYAIETTAERVVAQGTYKEVDPQGLRSEQQVASFASPSLDAGYVERSTTTKTIAGQTLTTIRGGLRSTAEDITREATISVADMVDGRTDTFATIINPSGLTAAQIAQAYFSSNRRNINFMRVRVKLENSSKAVVELTTRTNDRMTRGRILDEDPQELVMAKLNGSAVQVFLAEKPQQKAGIWCYRLAPQRMHRIRVAFSVRIRSTAYPFPLHFDKVEKANSSPFMGYSAGQIVYLGPQWEGNLSIPAADIEYMFLADSLGQFDLSGVTMGNGYTTADLAAYTGPGWINASVLGFAAAPLTQASFNDFGF